MTGTRTRRPGARRQSTLATRLMMPSAELARIVGSEPASKVELCKRLWAYIETHGLEDPRNPRTIHTDAPLEVIAGGKQVSLLELTRRINPHLTALVLA